VTVGRRRFFVAGLVVAVALCVFLEGDLREKRASLRGITSGQLREDLSSAGPLATAGSARGRQIR